MRTHPDDIAEVKRVHRPNLSGEFTRPERPPPRIDGIRHCHCGTRLSAYNQDSTCWRHTPYKAPARIRGRREPLRILREGAQ